MSLCKKSIANRSALPTPLGLHIFKTHYICIHTYITVPMDTDW